MTKKQRPMPYVHQEYPKWKYADGGRSAIVDDPDQEAALGPGWADHPAQLAVREAAPESAPVAATHEEAEARPAKRGRGRG